MKGHEEMIDVIGLSSTQGNFEHNEDKPGHQMFLLVVLLIFREDIQPFVRTYKIKAIFKIL